MLILIEFEFYLNFYFLKTFVYNNNIYPRKICVLFFVVCCVYCKINLDNTRLLYVNYCVNSARVLPV